MTPQYSVLLSLIISLLVVSWIHPRLVKIALLKNLVDNPDSRKLQRQPVPVLGGIAVFFGIVIGYGSVCGMVNYAGMLIVIMAMMVMLYIGTMDDILSLSPALRFAVEFFVALLLIFNGGYLLDDFHGLWGVGMLPDWMAVPLTVVAVVGIINAINLIDGVNGLSSGYCITACTMFGTLFYLSGDMKMTILAAQRFRQDFENVHRRRRDVGHGSRHNGLRHRDIAQRFVVRGLRGASGRVGSLFVGRPVHSGLRYAAGHVLAYSARGVAVPARQNPPAPYVYQSGVFACRRDAGHRRVEHVCRVVLVGVDEIGGFDRRAALCRCRHGLSGHVRALSLHGVAFAQEHFFPAGGPPPRLPDPCQPAGRFSADAALSRPALEMPGFTNNHHQRE